MRAFVPSAVATFPAITCNSGYFSFINLTHFITFSECPCAESRTTTSTLAFIKASHLSKTSFVIPRAAPQRSLPCKSFAEFGYLICFSISFIVIRPFKLPDLSTIGSFSTLAFASIFFASSKVIPSKAVTKLSFVIHSEIFLV